MLITLWKKKIQNWIVDRSTAGNFTVCISRFLKIKSCEIGGSLWFFSLSYYNCVCNSYLQLSTVYILSLQCILTVNKVVTIHDNEGIYKWINSASTFFWYKLLPTTSEPQKFQKIRFWKVSFFHFPMHLTNE